LIQDVYYLEKSFYYHFEPDVEYLCGVARFKDILSETKKKTVLEVNHTRFPWFTDLHTRREPGPVT
jgi:hypothetical protein